ncbi:MAG: hypothetical protein JNL97_04145, partial [Verrucomicrobiales bacterium]|nr:hypothetical protein [Verrucomicrobiales bacterium]
MIRESAASDFLRRWIGCLATLGVWMAAAGFVGIAVPASAAPPRFLGDLDGDGVATVLDLVRMVNHVTGVAPLAAEEAPFADLDQDSYVNDRDLERLATGILGQSSLPALPLARVRITSPDEGEPNVAVTREVVFRFTLPLGEAATVTTDRFAAFAGGRKLLSRVEISADRRGVTLFFLEPIPGNSQVTARFDGAGVVDFLGRAIDPDGNGEPGGVAELRYETLGTEPVGTTAVVGRVFASELIPGADNTSATVNVPLQGVTITVDGREEQLRTTTDANGSFKLQPVPAGTFFVHVDGRTAVGSQWPNGSYYPAVGKAWEAIAGREDNLAGGNGEIYLPRIVQGTLTPVSASSNTVVTFTASVIQSNTALAGVRLDVPPNALLSENGTRGGRVGIAPVSPDRLPEPLPDGLDFPLVITVQTDGASNFDRPVPIRFPNLPDPTTGEALPPGAKSALWSFNHDKGEWEVVGPMTVTADGKFVETDPGVGILQPGWHGTQPGGNNRCDRPRRRGGGGGGG